jgi:hypothetical protein
VSEDEQYRWWRYPLPRGESYPIKRMEFDRALLETPVAALRQVVLSTDAKRTPQDFFLYCGLPLPKDIRSDWVPFATATWFSVEQTPPLCTDVTFYAAHSSSRTELNRTLVTGGLPRLLRWIREIESGPETRRSETQRIAMSCPAARSKPSTTPVTTGTAADRARGSRGKCLKRDRFAG